MEAWTRRVTASIVFTEGRVWQAGHGDVARAVGNFVRLGPRNTPPGFAAALFAEEDAHA